VSWRLVALVLSLWASAFAAAPAWAAGAGCAQISAQRDDDASVAVPYLFGLTRDRAQALANDACLTARFSGPNSSDAKVVDQSVPAAKRVRPYTVILLRMAIVNSAVVPSLIGLSRDAATAKAEASGLKPLFYGTPGPHAAVLSQSRPSEQTVAWGSFIELQMVAPKTIAVPDFVGKTRSQAEASAAAAHFAIAFTGPDDASARVVGQSPEPGALVPPGTAVQLQVALARVTVPNLRDRTRAAAAAILARHGLVLDISGDQDPRARVVRQSPAAGASANPGGHVAAVLAVSPVGETSPSDAGTAPTDTGSHPAGVAGHGLVSVASHGTTQVPDLSGQSEAEARDFLVKYGLVPAFVGDTSKGARVTSQSPAAYTSVRRGSRVNVVMAQPISSSHLLLGTGIGGAIVLAGGAFWMLRRKWNPERDEPPVDETKLGESPVEDTEEDEAKDRTRPPAFPLVTFAASVDQGRPTVRLSGEPIAAARALPMDVQQEGQS
jgi:beta-lactam-binding protein with PASTA domain